MAAELSSLRAFSSWSGLSRPIHVFLQARGVLETWMLATRASMTNWTSVVVPSVRAHALGIMA
ncbi:MAG: hypothetical protein DI537_01295 [Stutzerimonas stutzeri]|nr:MAG: hypothetical protein DI537_01295 [Stutzerimonas stutzeri]